MNRVWLALLVLLIPFEANAIVRYLVQDMTCDEVQGAIERDGAAILYRKASASGVPLYNRYVSGPEFCETGQKIARASVATADSNSCSVSTCEDVNRP